MNNQCDGCIRGVPIVNGIHKDEQYFGMMCSKERYEDMSRTRRKSLRGGKSVDKSCRNNGGCPVCEGNRLHKHNKRKVSGEDTNINQRIEE